MVRSEAFQGFAQRSANGRHFGQLGGRQIVKILVHGFAGMDLVLDAIEARHEQRRISEIGVGHRVGEADFHALGFCACAIGNAARCRTVARRIGEQNGCFIARDQTLVAVGRGVGEGVH